MRSDRSSVTVGRVQRPEQADDGLVRVQIGRVGGPSAEELALTSVAEDLAVKRLVGVGVEATRGVGKDVTVLAGGTEEDLHGVKLASSIGGVADVGEKRFDIADADQLPVGDGPVGVEVSSQLTNGGQLDFEVRSDRGLAPEGVRVPGIAGGGRRMQLPGNGTGREFRRCGGLAGRPRLGGRVKGKRQPGGHEVGFQCPRQFGDGRPGFLTA